MPDARLQAELGGDPPPPGVSALDDAAQSALADLVATAKADQTAALQRSFTDTLKHVPFPVRRIVKKVLLG